MWKDCHLSHTGRFGPDLKVQTILQDTAIIHSRRIQPYFS